MLGEWFYVYLYIAHAPKTQKSHKLHPIAKMKPVGFSVLLIKIYLLLSN